MKLLSISHEETVKSIIANILVEPLKIEMLTFDLVTVGHFSIDSIKTRKDSPPKHTLGGPPTFVSLAARKMNVEVSVISNVGDDFPNEYYEWLINEGIDLSMLRRIRNASTTRYMLIYSGKDERQLILKARAPPIELEEIPESLSAKVIHISPIAGEVSYEVTEKLKQHSNLLSLDPQGLLRRFDEEGRVYLRGLDDPRILSKIDVLKASEREVEVATGEPQLNRAIRHTHERGVNVVIVTRGRQSIILSLNGKIYRIPTVKSKVIVDTTGAGDVFIGAFLAEYIKGEDPVWSSCVGSASASYVIEKIGPMGFRSQSEVYERAAQIYEKVSPATSI